MPHECQKDGSQHTPIPRLSGQGTCSDWRAEHQPGFHQAALANNLLHPEVVISWGSAPGSGGSEYWAVVGFFRVNPFQTKPITYAGKWRRLDRGFSPSFTILNAREPKPSPSPATPTPPQTAASARSAAASAPGQFSARGRFWGTRAQLRKNPPSFGSFV